MEYKFLDLEWKADDEGMIEGYGSLYGNVDQGGDVVVAGAFAESLASGRKVKMLYQHDAYSVIGVWNVMAEDEIGLRVKGKILTAVSAGRDAYELVKADALDGLSIGYRTIKDSVSNGVRMIEKAQLFEVSLVTFPMNEMARIDAVKAAEMSRRDLERVLTQDAKISRAVARQLMAGGYEAIKVKQDAGAEGLSELAAMMRGLPKNKDQNYV